MDPTTEDKKSRVQRVLEVHDFLREADVRLLLCHEYTILRTDPTIRGPEDIQLRLELFVDVLSRLSEYEVRNRMAVCQEFMTTTWRDAIDQLALDDDE